MVGLVLYIIVVISTYFCRDLGLLYAIITLGGISETGRYYVAYVYIIEMMPKRHQENTGLMIFMVFGFAMTYFALQFWFITKNVFINCIGAGVLSIYSLISTYFWMPESPRWLFS